MTNHPVLSVHKISMRFGGLNALNKVSLQVFPREIAALIGPNGAGKTTFFNCVTGIYKPSGGYIELNGPDLRPKRINGLKPNLITRSGLARTFQNIRLFENMSVLENVMVGCHCRTTSNFLNAIIQTSSFKKEEQGVIEKSYELLKLVGLQGSANLSAKNLPYAEQRSLEIARALATEPRLLLLDEPAAGMNPQETTKLDQLIMKIRERFNLAVLLIEHDMKLVMRISDKVFVMAQGEKIAEGTPGEIQNNPRVIKAYLGEEVDVVS
ncbi:MAG: ABC transporter ATP-binding protein [Deltaproteobacteria bacterium]|nr:ABC transporter ATP-binding protein [Deltaproteobacteria bacterium]